MFKNIEMNFDGPICGCDYENLEWGIDICGGEYIGVIIECMTCREQLLISEDDFVALFNFEEGYPLGQIEEREEVKLKLIKGGK